MSKQWELEAYERAKKADSLYSAQMRSWSPFFRNEALWERYVKHWREARPKDAADDNA